MNHNNTDYKVLNERIEQYSRYIKYYKVGNNLYSYPEWQYIGELCRKGNVWYANGTLFLNYTAAIEFLYKKWESEK